MTCVLFATDGSDHARRATDAAVAAAIERDLPLHVVSVVDSRVRGEPGLSTAELSTIAAEDRQGAVVDEAAEKATEAGLEVETALRHGVPHEAVLAYADQVDAALIVVGKHGDHHDHLGGVGRRIVEGTDREVRVGAMPA